MATAGERNKVMKLLDMKGYVDNSYMATDKILIILFLI
jgi:hypothetical protein